MAPDIAWSEAAGMPFGGEYNGPNQVLEAIFTQIPVKFDHFEIEIESLQEAGQDSVVMVGWYNGTAKKTGNKFRARAMHHSTFNDGKVTRFVQLADTAVIRDTLG